MSNGKKFTLYNGYCIDTDSSDRTFMANSFVAADGERIILIQEMFSDKEKTLMGLTAQQAKRLARRLLKLATERIDDDEPQGAGVTTTTLGEFFAPFGDAWK